MNLFQSRLSSDNQDVVMKVLIAEDDALSRWYLDNVLSSWGYEVTACENGGDAWNCYLRDDFNLIISDWAMPVMDGIELCRRIRMSNLSDQCYFILLSSRIGKAGFVQDSADGVDVYMSKPVDAVQLKNHLKMAEFLLDLRAGKSLQRLLPMCSWCKKTRIDDDLWCEVDELLAEGHFTYSICPECSRQLKVARAGSRAE